MNLLGNWPVQVFQILFKITTAGVEMSENHIFFTIALHKVAGDTDTELFAHDHVVLDGIFCKHQQNDRKTEAFLHFSSTWISQFRQPGNRSSVISRKFSTYFSSSFKGTAVLSCRVYRK